MKLDKKFFTKLEKQIDKDFGKRCNDLHWGCPTCGVWFGFDLLEGAYPVLTLDIMKKAYKKLTGK